MRLIYADEAGISNPKQEPFVVVSAAIIHADQKLTEIERHLDKLVARHIPQEHQADYVFHATEIFNGGKVIKRHDPEWPDEKRFAIADDLAAIPAKFRIPIAFGWVERAIFPQTFQLPPETTEAEKAVAAHVNAFVTCAMMVEHWMRQNASNEVCLMIVEDNDQARKLIRDTQRYYQDRKIEPMLDPSARKHFPFRKIKEDPLFQPKRKSSALQIADFCAYAFKRFLMKDRRYDRFAEPFWSQVVSFDDDFVKKVRRS